MLAEVREGFAGGARTVVETDLSVPRALEALSVASTVTCLSLAQPPRPGGQCKDWEADARALAPQVPPRDRAVRPPRS